MAIDRKALLKKIAESTVSSGGNNLRDGRGRLAVKKIAFEDGFKGTRFVAEFIVMGSAKIPVQDVATGKALEIEPNPIGSEVSYIQLLEKHESAFGNVKGFVLALFGEKDDGSISNDEIIDTIEHLTTSNQAYGMVIDYETFRKLTEKNKVQITIPKWFSVEQTPEDIQKVRAWLEALQLGTQAQALGAPVTA